MTTPPNRCFLGPTRIEIPNAISIASAVVARTAHGRVSLYFTTGRRFPLLKAALSHGGSTGPPLTRFFLWPPYGVWGTPANFNGFRDLASSLHRRRSTQVNQTLHDVWPSPGLLHYIYIFGGSLAPNGILPGAKFIFRPSLVFRSYICSVTARHSSTGRQPNFAKFS